MQHIDDVYHTVNDRNTGYICFLRIEILFISQKANIKFSFQQVVNTLCRGSDTLCVLECNL